MTTENYMKKLASIQIAVLDLVAETKEVFPEYNDQQYFLDCLAIANSKITSVLTHAKRRKYTNKQ